MIYEFPKPFLVFLFILISGLLPATAQSSRVDGASQADLSVYIREKHGFDQALINGILYYNKYYRVLNHPYYIGEKSLPGSVILSGISYDNVQINYDIYSQYLVLEYQGLSGGPFKIILSPEHTDAFRMVEDYFEKISLDEKGPLFYQVIRAGGLICYIHWEKQMIATTYNFQYPDIFTDPKRTYFMDFYGKLSPFTNRRNFVSLCTGVPKKKIKKYMRENGIRFSNASSEQIKSLIKFVSSDLQSTTGN